MKVSELKTYVQGKVVYTQYVMNMFHAQTNDNCIAVILSSAGQSNKNTGDLLFQFLVRSADPELAEAKAFDIHNHFNEKTSYMVAQTKVIRSRGQQSVPLYTGTDESGRHIYSVNIIAMVDNN